MTPKPRGRVTQRASCATRLGSARSVAARRVRVQWVVIMGRDSGVDGDADPAPRAGSGIIAADLSVMPALDLITWLGNRQRTGTLQFGDGAVVRQATIVAGRAVRMHSSRTSESFAQFLREAGLSYGPTLAQALRDARSSGARLGFVLAAAHGASPGEIRRVLEHQIRGLLLDAVRWTSGRLVFVDMEVDAARSEIPASVSLLDVRRIALARAREWSDLVATPADIAVERRR